MSDKCLYCGLEIERGGGGLWYSSSTRSICYENRGRRVHVLAEPSPEPEAAPAPEAQTSAAPEWYWGSRCVECGKQIPAGQMQHCLHGGYCNYHVPVALRAEVASLREKLARAEARVAILDAQEVKLPELDKTKRAWGVLVPAGIMDHLKQRESQLFDALRAIQAWRKVAHRQHDALLDALRGNDLAAERRQSIENWPGSDFRGLGYDAIAAYDALAGKAE